MFNKYIRDKYTGELRGEYQNIDFVEPGYIYEMTRPKVFKDIFDKGYWDGVDIHMVL